MSDDHREEQEMEAEALAAIFDDDLEVISSTQPFGWAIRLWPEAHGGGEGGDGGAENHVGVRVVADIPLDYPEVSLPTLRVEVLKGLTDEHAQELLALAEEEARANAGMPAMYAICERLREWLLENNVTGMDDLSMYAQMMKREKDKERDERKAQKTYEAQKQREELTEAESEDLAVRRRRAEGTPCTDETFYAWRDRFDAEQEAARLEAETAALADAKRKKGGGVGSGGPLPTDGKRAVDKSGRLTGFQQFSDRTGTLNLEAMEAAAENAQVDEDEEEDDDDLGDVDADLFDDEDDLDDLDFDDDDDDDDDDDEDGDDDDEPNI